MRRSLVLVAVAAVVALALPLASPAGEPPNQNDPCSSNGRNTCGTNGVGFYDTYRYGLRWFGDFDGAVAGAPHIFCIDLRYWYPSKAYRYRELAGDELENRDGETVPLSKKRQMAYAIWAYGRSTNESRQAAVMLYVHGLMGDAAPGEVDPAALGNPAVSSWYARLARDSARYHGPYRVETTFPNNVSLGERATATVRVVSASGAGVPNVDLRLSAKGGAVQGSATTDENGVARAQVLATQAGDLTIDVRSELVASTLPRYYVAVPPAPARNGQRLAEPTGQQLSTRIDASVSKTRMKVTTAATPQSLVVGGTVRDKVTITGARESWRGTVSVSVYGPFRTTAALRCTGEPFAKTSFKGNGPGTYLTPAVKATAPGYYTFQEIFLGDANHVGFITPCRDPAEQFKVDVRPDLKTIVSSQTTTPGAAIFDRVIVEGLLGETVTVQATLHGPFGTRGGISCAGKPIWAGTIAVPKDGEYQTAPVTLTVPGYYTYRESIAAGPFIRAVTTPCAEVSETTVVVGAPKLVTKVSAQRTRPGASITDKVLVTGLGALNVPVKAELFGPFATAKAIRCTGTPYWTGSFVAAGDGTYTTKPAKIGRAGYYTYRESIVASEATPAVETACAEVAETTIAIARPQVKTVVSSDVVLPGSTIFDRITVSGLGSTPAAIAVELYGPFRSSAAISCGGTPFWKGNVTAHGDGTVLTKKVKVTKVGFYTYREQLAGSRLVQGVTTACGVEAETSLVRPLVLTGRGDVAARIRALAADPGRRPVRVEYDALGIHAPVGRAGIDIKAGALAVLPNVHRAAWWVDGARPGDRAGSVLIAGHVDSAVQGPGAFKSLARAKVGDRIRVQTRNGKTFTYRVTSVRTYLKKALPAAIYSKKGKARLTLVTCGGPFNANLGHYRDNVVVTAVRT